MVREHVRRPPRGQLTFACTRCRITLRDGVDYTWCPRCNGEVDWIDPRANTYLCRLCGTLASRFFTARRDAAADHLDRLLGPNGNPRCEACHAEMEGFTTPFVMELPAAVRPMMQRARTWFFWLVGVQAALALLDPLGFPYLKPIIVVMQVIAIFVIGRVLVGSPEIRALARDHRTRIRHGLEHATIAVLAERGIDVIAGQTLERSFVLELPHDGRTWDRLGDIAAAARDAIHRVRGGEHELAYNPHCGTSHLVGAFVFALAVVGVGIAAIASAVPVGITFALTVAVTTVGRILSLPLGLLAQRWLTVSTHLESATLGNITRHPRSDARTLQVVVELDVVPRLRGVAAVAPTAL